MSQPTAPEIELTTELKDLPRITIKHGGIRVDGIQLMLWIPNRVLILQVQTQQKYVMAGCVSDGSLLGLTLLQGDHTLSSEEPDYRITEVQFQTPGPNWTCVVNEGRYTVQACWYAPTPDRIYAVPESDSNKLSFYRQF